MSNRLFLLVIFVLMTFAFHLAYILFLPNSEMNKLLAQISTETGANRFTILNEQKANTLLKQNPKSIVAAACLYDLSHGPVQVTNLIVGSYWSLSIYSERGDVIYTLNDRQVAAKQISISINRKTGETPGPLDFNDKASDENQATVFSEHQRGLIIVRSGINLPNQAEYILKQLEQSSCSS